MLTCSISLLCLVLSWLFSPLVSVVVVSYLICVAELIKSSYYSSLHGSILMRILFYSLRYPLCWAITLLSWSGSAVGCRPTNDNTWWEKWSFRSRSWREQCVNLNDVNHSYHIFNYFFSISASLFTPILPIPIYHLAYLSTITQLTRFTHLGSRAGGLSSAPPGLWRSSHCSPSTARGMTPHTSPAAAPVAPCWVAAWSANSCDLSRVPKSRLLAPGWGPPTPGQPASHMSLRHQVQLSNDVAPLLHCSTPQRLTALLILSCVTFLPLNIITIR